MMSEPRRRLAAARCWAAELEWMGSRSPTRPPSHGCLNFYGKPTEALSSPSVRPYSRSPLPIWARGTGRSGLTNAVDARITTAWKCLISRIPDAQVRPDIVARIARTVRAPLEGGGAILTGRALVEPPSIDFETTALIPATQGDSSTPLCVHILDHHRHIRVFFCAPRPGSRPICAPGSRLQATTLRGSLGSGLMRGRWSQ